jgi:hypothetical protein
MSTPLLVSAAEATSGINPFWIGGTVLLIFLVLLISLLAFGAGRDHS